MEKLLIYIKHSFPGIWRIIEKFNNVLFKLRFANRFGRVSHQVIGNHTMPGFTFRKIDSNDMVALNMLINTQDPQRLTFFKPHGFDEKSLKRTFRNPSFLMMGVFDGTRMVGYFFLRCFWNKKCFVGRLIDEPYEGKGIGRVMNQIMYNIGWQMNFRVLSTISKNNHWVMKSHAGNASMVVRKELANDYLLVEFVRPAQSLQ